MAFFFVWAGREKSITRAYEALSSELGGILFMQLQIPFTNIRFLIPVPMLVFCALTLAAPVIALASLKQVATICGVL